MLSTFKKGIKYLISHSRKVYVDTVSVSPNEILKDKVAIVTGGSSGIGKSIAKTFALQGAKVIITGRDKNKLKSVVKEIDNCEYYVMDIGNLDEQGKMIDYILEKYYKIDIVVNNAGVSHHERDFLSVEEKGFDEQFNINLKGPYFFTQRIIKKLTDDQKKNLNIIFISSERGSQCDVLPYGLTKASLNSLVQGLSYRFIREGIRINGIAPGVTASNMVSVDTSGNMAANDYVSGRYFLASEVAEIALFIASDNSKCISGEVIHTNDGNHINSYFKNF